MKACTHAPCHGEQTRAVGQTTASVNRRHAGPCTKRSRPKHTAAVCIGQPPLRMRKVFCCCSMAGLSHDTSLCRQYKCYVLVDP
jgi:hypothetical protein